MTGKYFNRTCSRFSQRNLRLNLPITDGNFLIILKQFELTQNTTKSNPILFSRDNKFWQ